MAANKRRKPQTVPKTPVNQASIETSAAGQTGPDLARLDNPRGESSKIKVVTLVLSSSLMCAIVGAYAGNRLEHSKAIIGLKTEDRKARISLYAALEDHVQHFEGQLDNVIGVVRLAAAFPDRNAAAPHLEAAFERLGRVMIEIVPMLNDRRIDASIRAQIQEVIDESTPKVYEAQTTLAGDALEQLYKEKIKQIFEDLQLKIEREKGNLLAEPL